MLDYPKLIEIDGQIRQLDFDIDRFYRYDFNFNPSAFIAICLSLGKVENFINPLHEIKKEMSQQEAITFYFSSDPPGALIKIYIEDRFDFLKSEYLKTFSDYLNGLPPDQAKGKARSHLLDFNQIELSLLAENKPKTDWHKQLKDYVKKELALRRRIAKGIEETAGLSINKSALVDIPSLKDHPKLTLRAKALLCVYEGGTIIRADGEKLYQHFNYYSKAKNRIKDPKNATPLIMENKILLFEEVINLLPEDKKSRANDDLKLLKNIRRSSYQ